MRQRIPGRRRDRHRRLCDNRLFVRGSGSPGRAYARRTRRSWSYRWISVRPDTTEHIVIEFDQPQTISRLVYEAEEAMRERTQEVRVEVAKVS